MSRRCLDTFFPPQHSIRLLSTVSIRTFHGSISPRLEPPPFLPTHIRPIVRFSYIPPQVAFPIRLSPTEPITQPLEAIAAVPDIPIISAQVRHGFDVMQAASRPDRQGCRHGQGRLRFFGTRPTSTPTALVPRATVLSPHGPSQDPGRVRHEIGDRFGFGGEGVDVLRLVAVDESEHVIGLAFNRGEEGTARERIVGTVEDEIVGEFGSCDGQVRLGPGRPLFGQYRAVLPEELEGGDVGCVEAGGADEDIERVLFARTADAAVRSDLGDLPTHNTDVVGGQVFEVLDAGRWPTAAYPCPWDDHGFEFRVLDFCLHLALDVGTHLRLRFAVGEEKAKGAVDPAFVLFAEFEQDSGRLRELFEFCLCVGSRWFGAKRSENPCSLTDKMVHVSDGWLYCFQDLLPRRSNRYLSMPLDVRLY